MQGDPPGRDGHVEAVSQLHPQGGERASSRHPLRQVPHPEAPERGIGQGAKERIRPALGEGPEVHQGPEIYIAVASRQPLAGGASVAEGSVQGQSEVEQGYLLKEMFSQLWDYKREVWARR